MPADTYFHLLERAQVSGFDRCADAYEHVSPQFDRSLYETGAATSFASAADAYRHWVEQGRSQGFPFAESKDTLLKIVLKCKDDTEYIQTWIEYHAQIVGHHNIVVLDCGSVDPEYWSIVNRYLGRVLILSYPHYYDRIHDRASNRNFYELIARNAKYVTLLDADEFMFGFLDGRVSAAGVRALLASGSSSCIAGTWFNNISTLPAECSRLDIDDDLDYAADRNWVSWGSTAGKAIIRTDRLASAEHIGHNLTSAAVARLVDAESFGKLGILHINRLSRRIEKKRALRHLRTKGIVSVDLVEDAGIAAALAHKRQSSTVTPIDALYIGRYLEEKPLPPTTKSFRLSLSQLLNGKATDANWADFETFGFAKLVESRRGEMARAAGC